MSEATGLLLTVFGAVISFANVVITYYNVSRTNRIQKEVFNFTKYTQFVQIIEKSAVLIEIENDYNELIKITNKGKLPIEHALIKISLSAQKDEETINLEDATFERNTTLQPEENFLIPLYVKLGEQLQNSKLLKKYKEQVPTSEIDLVTGEMIFNTISIKHILSEFLLNVQVDLNYRVFQENMRIRKEFVLQYRFQPEFFEPFGEDRFRFEENYTISCLENSGMWKD